MHIIVHVLTHTHHHTLVYILHITHHLTSMCIPYTSAICNKGIWIASALFLAVRCRAIRLIFYYSVGSIAPKSAFWIITLSLCSCSSLPDTSCNLHPHHSTSFYDVPNCTMAASSCASSENSGLSSISLGVKTDDFPFCMRLVLFGLTRSSSNAASCLTSFLGIFSACSSVSGCEYHWAFCFFLRDPLLVSGIFTGCGVGVCCCLCCVGISCSFIGCAGVSWVCSWGWAGSNSFCRVMFRL